eukprot:4258494-Lingulodinium_polyedra.AAC.1
MASRARAGGPEFWRTDTAWAILEMRYVRREAVPVSRELANPFTILGPLPGASQSAAERGDRPDSRASLRHGRPRQLHREGT